ncbi:hypothetical protein [uncultured Aquimarina sp.]|uniref:hypothetical protein n=1 Tax=uncultured Aquimarina sp. TaxID=575652 RepID=UPI00260CF257|nr:hypothetical protein [uncultured Aquimarina sp.]
MLEKNTLLKRIDEAISKEDTSSENKELLKEIKQELSKAKTEVEYFDTFIKIIKIISLLTDLGGDSG